MKHKPAAALIIAVVAGCGDDPLYFPFFASDTGGDAGGDTGLLDSGTDTGSDTGSTDISTSDTGGLDAEFDTRVEDSGADTPPTDPCDRVSCGANEVCDEGACVCEPGFIDTRDGCVLPDPDDPQRRTAEQVCERWNADYAEVATRAYEPGATNCDPGRIDPVGHEDAMRRLNLYRWLVGLQPASSDAGNDALCQAAAVMFHRNNAIEHFPPESWACYTDAGASAASSSNIALGYETAAQTVDGYVGDTGVPSLGHRRWCLFPGLDDVGFGHYGSGGAMWSFGSTSGRPNPEFVAYPPPGPVPASIAPGEWSFSAPSIRSAEVVVTDLASGDEIGVSPQLKDQGYGLDTVGWNMSGAIRAGRSYRVYVQTQNADWEYVVDFVNCR